MVDERKNTNHKVLFIISHCTTKMKQGIVVHKKLKNVGDKMANFQSLELASQHTWCDSIIQNQEVLSNFKPYVDILRVDIKENKNNDSIVEKQVVGSMISEANKNLKDAQDRLLYEFNGYTADDIKYSKLTEREQLVLRHRMTINRFIKIDELLALPPSSSYIAYESAIKKLQKYAKQKAKGSEKANLLSNQQIQIYELIQQGMKNKEIAEQLRIESTIVKTQKSRIKKLGLI